MGQQDRQTANGASLLVIDQACDNSQLLVSLSKNGTQWLSPVGWTDQQKVTLLDCRANGDTTEIDIPSEFAKDISSGDVLVLRCSELDLEKEIIWEASEVETRTAADLAPAATGLAGGLLSRFKSSKVEPVEDIKSEAEIRAEEADRAAQNFKVKMEAATAAKEEAQRKALEAAREAEAALKMEAERITEMERAAKAFEEAERLKQDELRRVEEERRAEEVRIAEEQRRIEEARKREIAAKKEAERKAALERYEAALDITRNEEIRLKDRLKTLKKQAKMNAENVAVQAEDLESRRGYLVTTEETAAKRVESYDKSALKLEGVNSELAMVQTDAETLSADRQALSIRLTQADADYQTAQKEAEAAIARAEAKREELDIIRRDEIELSSRMSSVSEKLSSQGLVAAELAEKTQKLHLKSETAQAELAQAKIEIEALEQAQQAQAEQDQNLRLEIEATQQAIEDSQAREVNHREAIEHLEAGGSPENISDITIEARSYETTGDNFAPENIVATDETPKTGLFNRARKSFAREKDAELSIEVEDVVLDAAESKLDPVLLAGLDDTPSFVRRHGSSLMALGAVIGGIAILGGGLALNRSASPKLEVKSSTPAQTQVMNAATKVELPKALDVDAVKDVVEAKVDTKAEITADKIELPKVETLALDTASLSAVADVPKLDLPRIEVEAEETASPVETESSPAVIKVAEVIDPTGFAFELPDMMPVVQPKKLDTKPAVKKASVKKIAVEKVTPKKVEVKAPAVPKVEAAVNYPELTSDVQTRLAALGFYNGDIDGLQGKTTKEAITTFKTLYAMPVDDKITGALLTELKRAEREQEATQLEQAAQDEALAQAQAQAQALTQAEELAAIQLAEATPAVEFYDTVQAVPSTPVVTDSLPAAERYIPTRKPVSAPMSAPVPAYVAPEPEPLKVASIPTVTEPAPTPAAEDVIVDAKILKNSSAEYPMSALRREYFVNVNILVSYDIDATGRTTNINIASNDHTGRFNDAFEKAAMKAVQKLRYKAKTVNGEPVLSKGRKKRIVFRTE